MNLAVVGEGLTGDRVDAMQAGLSVMGAADESVIVTDTFVETVSSLTGQDTYSTGRGAEVVAARTVQVDGMSTIVVNAVEAKNRAPEIIERLLAHEAGHVLLHRRQEGVEGRRHLIGADWQWWLLCLGGLALDEYRIERSLSALGYPISDIGAIAIAEDGLFHLNVEVVNALLDPASADTMKFAESIMRTHDWLAKQLAYFAAFRPDLAPPGLTVLSSDARRNWDEYIGSTWTTRAALYESVPPVLEPINEARLNAFLLQALEQESALLDKIGFRYGTVGNDLSFDRIASDALCNTRWERARREMNQRGHS